MIIVLSRNPLFKYCNIFKENDITGKENLTRNRYNFFKLSKKSINYNFQSENSIALHTRYDMIPDAIRDGNISNYYWSSIIIRSLQRSMSYFFLSYFSWSNKNVKCVLFFLIEFAVLRAKVFVSRQFPFLKRNCFSSFFSHNFSLKH